MDIRNTIRDLKVTLDRFKSANNKYYVEDVIVILDMIDDLNSRVEINTVRIAEKNESDLPQEELKPCPLCGLSVEYLEKTHYDYHDQNSRAIQCVCGISIEYDKSIISKANLILVWNRRSNA